MSGFVAVLSRRAAMVDESLLARLAAPLAAHAPDGRGSYRKGPVGLAHALLAVREDALAGPHVSPSGCCLAGDVRIDARPELRDALRGAGVAAAPDATDEALVLAAWVAWGEDAVDRLRGDFSFALWDPVRRQLLCARDAFGVRPLYYADVGGHFVCSNVLSAVRAHPEVSARVHEPAIVSFLCCGWNVDLTTTSFSDVRRLAPAHRFVVEPDSGPRAPKRHWSFPAPAPLVLAREEEYVERYRSVLDAAVRDRLRVQRASILLSGGLDSTSLAATVRRVAPSATLVAFTTEASALVPNDDVPLAALVAQYLGIRHEIVEDISPALEHFADGGFRPPEPLDDPEHAAWMRLAARMASVSPVAFMGEDGDALFRPPSLVAMLRTWPVLDVLGRAARFTLRKGRHPHLGINVRKRLREVGRPVEPPPPRWLRRDVLARTGVPRPAPHPTHPTRAETQRFLLGTTWQSLIESCEPACTGSSLELRWPFLDTRVLEFALAIPPIPWCQRKELVRVAFRDELPDAVIHRPKTTLPGYEREQVTRWRALQPWNRLALGPRVQEFVDGDCLFEDLRRGSCDDVLAAWRALALDQWLRTG